MTTFLVTGATGNLGRAALRALADLAHPRDIHPLIRSDEASARFSSRGFSPRQGDYGDPASLAAAFSGVDRLLFVSSPALDPAIRITHHVAVLEAANAAGVSQIVYTSAMGATHDPGHRSTEEWLSAGRIKHTVLRNGLYTEPFVTKALHEAQGGEVLAASGGRRLATACISDLGEAAALALVGRASGQVHELRGPAWSFADLAAAAAVELGIPVAAKEVADELTGPFAVLFPLVRAGFYDAETDDLRQILGRAPRTVADVLREVRPPR